jgi:hypothetical protein
MAKPEMETKMGPMANRKRCLAQSDTVATIMAKTKATAHGGTDRSWVWIGSNL